MTAEKVLRHATKPILLVRSSEWPVVLLAYGESDERKREG